MMTVQGDFPNSDEADQAKTRLMQSGIGADRIRVWNILPDREAGHGGRDTAAAGALLGGSVGGGTGFALGAAIGAVLGDDDAPHLPAPSGVRVVVDADGNGEQIQDSLRASGAAHIRTSRASG